MTVYFKLVYRLCIGLVLYKGRKIVLHIEDYKAISTENQTRILRVVNSLYENT